MANNSMENKVFSAELIGRDRITITDQGGKLRIEVIGCPELLDLMEKYKGFGKLSQWPEPKGNNHSAILLREILAKVQGKWELPYAAAELCHCRNVLTQTVDQAIVAGAHTTDQVSRQTSASTACGTCRPDVQKLLDYRLR